MTRPGTQLTLELKRRNYVDLHDGLEDDGTTLGERLLEGTLGGETESQLGGIDLVSRSVLEDELATRDGVTSEDTAFEGIVESLPVRRASVSVCQQASKPDEVRTFCTAGI